MAANGEISPVDLSRESKGCLRDPSIGPLRGRANIEVLPSAAHGGYVSQSASLAQESSHLC